ncbi:hypothetical protein QMY50_01424 [Escherichia coli]|nr:hypothetical protein QMY50_01424 [Escherichia coli]
MSAGRLNKKSLGIVMLLSVGLLLAGCSGSKSSDTGTYSGSVYTVKRGDTLYRISRTTGTSVKELARLNGISPPYTIEVGQKLKLGGVDSIGQRNSYVKTWGCGGFLNETNIYSRGKSLCF